jgi:HK97 family phage major capsid protein
MDAPQNAMDGDTGAAGGFSVPHPMAAEIIRLVEEYGVFRRYSRVMPMTSATLDVPKRTSGLTVKYPATQGAEIVASDVIFEQVNLVAKKAAQLSIWSTELDEDSIISMTDLITTEMAWAFAQAEDLNSFLGDGTGTFNNISGIEDALLAGAKVVGDGSTGASVWSDTTLANYHEMIGKLAWYPGIQPVWFINHQGFSESMQAILYGLGGNTVATGAGGTPMEFLGSPVVRTQVLTRNPLTADQMIAVFGDLRMTTMMGNRRDVTMIMLRELYAANDQIGIQSTMRTDTQVHDIGTATEAGGLVGLFSP